MADGRFDLIYLAIVMSLSSTLIVVKLLREKFELKILSGRLTLGVLVVQDIWAILFMAVQPSLAEPGVLQIAQSIAGGAVLVGVAFLASRYILAPLLEASARRPELVLISSVAWCFGIAGVADQLGLSREMGALIAGVSISAFPYGADVISKVTGRARLLRHPLLRGAGDEGAGAERGGPRPGAAHRDLRAGEPRDLRWCRRRRPRRRPLRGHGHRAEPRPDQRVLARHPDPGHGLWPRLGAGERGGAHRHDPDLAAVALSDHRERPHRPVAPAAFGRPDAGGVAAPAAEARPVRDIVLLGHFRIAQAVLDLVEAQAPQLKDRITLVDYDANRAHAVVARGFRWEYGDLANPDALEHLGIEEARIVVTTISDTFLKGISTRRLVGNLRRLAPRAVIVMTGEERTDLEDLLRAGADHVLIPGEITGERILELLRRAAPSRRGPWRRRVASGRAAGAERRAAPALVHRDLGHGLALELGQRLHRPAERHHRGDRHVGGRPSSSWIFGSCATASVVMVPARPSWRAASRMFQTKG